jgi:tetratricopeptide (TPR) repeat protein
VRQRRLGLDRLEIGLKTSPVPFLLKRTMTAQDSAVEPPAPAAPPATWRWQGIAGSLRRQPLLVWVVGVSCVFLVVAAAYLFVLPELLAQREWRRAQQATHEGDHVKAREHLEACLAVWKQSGETHFQMARTCRRAGDFERARIHLHRAGELRWPSPALDLEYLLMQTQEFGPRGDDEATLHHYILSGQHPEERLILESLVKGYLHTFYLGNADRWLSYWIEVHPEDWQPYLWRGQLRERLKRDDDAIKDYRGALKLNPRQDEAALRLARVLQLRGTGYEEAHRLFQGYLAGHPKDASALLGLANCQRSLRDAEGARKTLEGLLEHDPDVERAYLVFALLESDLENYPRALAYLRKAEAIKANEPDVVHQLSLVLRRLGRDEEADKYHAKHQELEQALKDLEAATRAVMLNPRDLDKRCQAGRILLQAGEEEGVRWLITALQEDPNHRPTQLALAEYYEKSSDRHAQQMARELRRRAGVLPEPESSPP